MNTIILPLLAAVIVATTMSEDVPACADPYSDACLSEENPGVVMGCMAENWSNGEDQIKACRDCFKSVSQLFQRKVTPENFDEYLPKAKACVSQFWPTLNQVLITI